MAIASKVWDGGKQDSPQASRAGRFRAGMLMQGRPASLDTWRITTGDPDVADAVSAQYGGTVAEWDTKTDESLEVITEVASVPVVAKYLSSQLSLMGLKGPIRSCDGITQKDEGGSPCACPSDPKERWEAQQNGSACSPDSKFYFSLTELPDLGDFAFYTGSIGFAKAATAELEAAIADAEEGLPGEFLLVAKTNKSGQSYRLATFVPDQPVSVS